MNRWVKFARSETEWEDPSLKRMIEYDKTALVSFMRMRRLKDDKMGKGAIASTAVEREPAAP